MRNLGLSIRLAIATLDLAACDTARIPIGDGFAYETSYPEDEETPWSDDAQGVAHDASSWYLSDTWTIYKYPLAADLARGTFTNSVSLPPGCGHFGDIAEAGGLLYAPLELCDGASRGRLYVYDADTLAVRRWASIPMGAQRHASWIAVSPEGLIVSSDTNATALNVYAPEFATGGMLRLLRQIPLDRTYHTVAGGEFSETGELYLISGEAGDPDPPGITIFDLGKRDVTVLGFIPVPLVGGRGLELEGITVWSLDGLAGKQEGIRADVRWILLDNDWPDSDNASLEHVTVGSARTGG